MFREKNPFENNNSGFKTLNLSTKQLVESFEKSMTSVKLDLKGLTDLDKKRILENQKNHLTTINAIQKLDSFLNTIHDSKFARKTLKKINLSGNDLSHMDTLALKDLLTNNQIESLNLSNCLLPDSGLEELTLALATNRSLIKIDISNIRKKQYVTTQNFCMSQSQQLIIGKFNDEELANFLRALEGSKSSLETLDISDIVAITGDRGYAASRSGEALKSIAATFYMLKYLNACAQKIPSDCIGEIAVILQNNKTILRADFTKNRSDIESEHPGCLPCLPIQTITIHDEVSSFILNAIAGITDKNKKNPIQREILSNIEHTYDNYVSSLEANTTLLQEQTVAILVQEEKKAKDKAEKEHATQIELLNATATKISLGLHNVGNAVSASTGGEHNVSIDKTDAKRHAQLPPLDIENIPNRVGILQIE